MAEQGKPGSAVHLYHDPLGSRVDTLGAAVVVREGESGVDGTGHTSRRNLTETTTRRPSTGTSATARPWQPCTRPVGCPHTGHGTGSSRVRNRNPDDFAFVRHALDDEGRQSRKHHAHKLVDIMHTVPTTAVTLHYHRLRARAVHWTDPCLRVAVSRVGWVSSPPHTPPHNAMSDYRQQDLPVVTMLAA